MIELIAVNWFYIATALFASVVIVAGILQLYKEYVFWKINKALKDMHGDACQVTYSNRTAAKETQAIME